jgi:hypothetical protein
MISNKHADCLYAIASTEKFTTNKLTKVQLELENIGLIEVRNNPEYDYVFKTKDTKKFVVILTLDGEQALDEHEENL